MVFTIFVRFECVLVCKLYIICRNLGKVENCEEENIGYCVDFVLRLLGVF